MQPVLLNWGANNFSGWGIDALCLLLQWANDPDIRAMIAAPVTERDIPATDPLRIMVARDAIMASNNFLNTIRGLPAWSRLDIPVVTALGNGLVAPSGLLGTRSVARCVFEDTRLTGLDEKLARYDVLLCACNWNGDFLKAHSTKPVEVVLQGIDSSLFHPAPKSGILDPGRFYIFSGGKVEFRKGHDLTLLAFREFSRRHPDAVLVTLWHSPWPQVSAGFKGRLDAALTLTQNGAIDVPRWLAANGIDPAKVIELPQMPNPLMPAIFREMDCALAPSRAEAGTNLCAIEAMACGVPTIIADNTGGSDIIGQGNCIALKRQSPVRNPDIGGTEDWRESDVEEILEALEALYADTALRKKVGREGADWLIREDAPGPTMRGR